MLVWLIVAFVIFAVFDLSPLIVCINCSFFYIYYCRTPTGNPSWKSSLLVDVAVWLPAVVNTSLSLRPKSVTSSISRKTSEIEPRLLQNENKSHRLSVIYRGRRCGIITGNDRNGHRAHRFADIGTNRLFKPNYNASMAILAASDATYTAVVSTVGDRAFPVAGYRPWNSLPLDVTSAPMLIVFRNRLKTHLFSWAFPSQLLTVFCFCFLHREQ